MRVTGVIETALSVADPAASAAFYRRLFGFRVLLESERLVALDVAGRSVLLLFARGQTDGPLPTAGGVIPGHGASGRSHLAFGVGEGEIGPWERRLGEEGVAVESVVTWPGGAKSVYFRDPDDHLVELITPGFWAIY